MIEIKNYKQGNCLQCERKGVKYGKSSKGIQRLLVLTDTDKAMVLPKVDSPHLNIQNPSPGMMVYDTLKRQLAVYNGTVWSFWKP